MKLLGKICAKCGRRHWREEFGMCYRCYYGDGKSSYSPLARLSHRELMIALSLAERSPTGQVTHDELMTVLQSKDVDAYIEKLERQTK